MCSPCKKIKMQRTALITGSSNGIGYELARIHAMKGGDLILVARSLSKLREIREQLENKYHVQVYIIGKDLSVASSAKEIFEEVKENHITVEYLINNAGFGNFGLFAESDWSRQEQMINLNVTTLAYFTWLFLPEMIYRRSGKVMNVASVASFAPGPTMAVYYATKAFVLSFSEAIYNEVSDYGITVTALCPGPTQSGFQETASLQGSKLFTGKNIPAAREVAQYGYRSMMKGKTVAIHGIKNKILAHSIRIAPRSLVPKITRRIQEKQYVKEK